LPHTRHGDDTINTNTKHARTINGKNEKIIHIEELLAANISPSTIIFFTGRGVGGGLVAFRGGIADVSVSSNSANSWRKKAIHGSKFLPIEEIISSPLASRATDTLTETRTVHLRRIYDENGHND
jgi:hypothetical protein